MSAMQWIAGAALFASASAVFSQNSGTPPPPQNVVQLSASAAVDVRQDQLTLVLSTTREGPEPAAVQNELKTAVDAALVEAKKSAEAGQLDVRTGAFSLYPRQNKDGRIGSWQGRAELVLEGRDFARISAAAGRIQSMTVNRTDFSLSREQRAKAEADAQQQAVDNFRAKGDQLAKSFGFAGYTLREVSVNANDQFPPPPMRMRTMAAATPLAADAPVPLEAGNSTVLVVVSGSVQLK